MEKALLFLEKYKYWIFGLAILLAVGLRVWDFSDAMLLKGDQIRDAVMSARSFENGLGELSLLGPRAGGTKLRLGPVFYYFQSAAAGIFGSLQPAVLAVPNLIFSILAIPLLFLLLRFYFSKNISLFLAALFAFSFLAFEYSRFTWNPNSIPFFVLLFLYAWLRIFSAKERLGWQWFLLLGFAFAVASQLHFTSMVALGLFAAIFLFFNYKNFWKMVGWKNLAIVVGIVAFFYTPVILSDILNKGDNLNLFFKSIGSKASDHSLLQNINKEFYYFGKYFFRLAFGYMGSMKILHYVGAVMLLGGVALNVFLLRRESDSEKKNFLLVILFWTAAFLLLYFPLAYDIDKPRFFLPLIFLPYVYVGFLWQWLTPWKKIKRSLVIVLAVAMLLGNLTGSLLWLSEFARAQSGSLDARDTVILKVKKDKAWWTWGMIEKAALVMSDQCKGGAIYYYLPSEQNQDFQDVFNWAFKLNGEQREFAFTKKINPEKKGCFFAVTKQSFDAGELALKGDFERVGNVGDIAINKLKRGKEEEQVAVVEDKKVDNAIEEEFPVQLHQRAYWKDVFKIF